MRVHVAGAATVDTGTPEGVESGHNRAAGYGCSTELAREAGKAGPRGLFAARNRSIGGQGTESQEPGAENGG